MKTTGAAGSEAASRIIEGNKLEVADVILCRHKRSFFSWLIMWGTKSHWSHAALVFVIRNENAGFGNSFVIESIRDGISITNLRDYLEDVRHYDIGIKRLERPWFANSDSGLAIRKKVRGQMLDFIKKRYDVGMIFQIAAMVLAKLIFGARSALYGLEHEIQRTHRKKKLVPSEFICSGFVQYALYATVRDLVQQKQLSLDDLKAVVLNPKLANHADVMRLPLSTLLATTPEDIAQNQQLTWKYVVKGGRPYEVRSPAEVDAIMGRR